MPLPYLRIVGPYLGVSERDKQRQRVIPHAGAQLDKPPPRGCAKPGDLVTPTTSFAFVRFPNLSCLALNEIALDVESHRSF